MQLQRAMAAEAEAAREARAKVGAGGRSWQRPRQQAETVASLTNFERDCLLLSKLQPFFLPFGASLLRVRVKRREDNFL